MKHDSIITKYAVQIEPVGSRVTCSPPPTDTDEDYLVLVNSESEFYGIATTLQCHKDYVLCGDEEYLIPADEAFYDGYFQSFRKGDLNYIITDNKEFFENFMKATAIAKEANFMKKGQRVALFQWILYGTFTDEFDAVLDFMGIVERPPTEAEAVEAIHKAY